MVVSKFPFKIDTRQFNCSVQCNKMLEQYRAVGSALFRYGDPAHLAVIDAPESPDITERYGVTKFPTLKWFQ